MAYGVGLRRLGPVVWWQPVEGERHALPPTRRPHPGEERETLCGREVVLLDPTDVDWLMPTCDECMALAIERTEQREQEESRGGPPETEQEALIRRLTGPADGIPR